MIARPNLTNASLSAKEKANGAQRQLQRQTLQAWLGRIVRRLAQGALLSTLQTDLAMSPGEFQRSFPELFEEEAGGTAAPAMTSALMEGKRWF